MDEQNEREPEKVYKAAAVCYRRVAASIEILLVKAHSGGWVFPKGGIEPGEQPCQAARREAFEEAGVSGEIDQKQLTTFLHFKPGVNREYRVAAFLLLVTGMQPSRESERQPTWFSPPEAEKAIIQLRQFKYAEEYKRVIRMAVASLTEENRGKEEVRI
jgi:8-oxo-dGTP pyrophosphatase MutT (NUDIX family)